MKKMLLITLITFFFVPMIVSANQSMTLADSKYDFDFSIPPGSWMWLESSSVVENMGFYGSFTVDVDIDFFIVNQDGFNQISGGSSASSSNVLYDYGTDLIGTVDFSFITPDVSKVYWCFSNWDAIFTTVTVEGSIFLDTTAPELDIISPNNHQTVDGTIFIQADAEDARFDVAVMRIYIDNQLRKTEYSDSVSYSWDTTTVSDGQHSVKFYVSDNVNNDAEITRYVTVDNIPDPTDPVDPVDPGGGATNPAPLSPMTDMTTMVVIGIIGVVAIVGIVAGLSRRGTDMTEPRTIVSSEKVFVLCRYCGAKTEQGLSKCEKCGADL